MARPVDVTLDAEAATRPDARDEPGVAVVALVHASGVDVALRNVSLNPGSGLDPASHVAEGVAGGRVGSATAAPAGPLVGTATKSATARRALPRTRMLLA